MKYDARNHRLNDKNLKTLENEKENTMKSLKEKVNEFAQLVEDQTKARYVEHGYQWSGWQRCCKAVVKPGKKYIKVDVGDSGRLMIDQDGIIYGIKGYGVINKKRTYGTLDTTDQYFWGEYAPMKLKKDLNKNKCKCGSVRFYARRVVYMPVIVDEFGNFDSNLSEESADAESPYGPFECVNCHKVYEDLTEITGG